jgi:hypothetical protein
MDEALVELVMVHFPATETLKLFEVVVHIVGVGEVGPREFAKLRMAVSVEFAHVVVELDPTAIRPADRDTDEGVLKIVSQAFLARAQRLTLGQSTGDIDEPTEGADDRSLRIPHWGRVHLRPKNRSIAPSEAELVGLGDPFESPHGARAQFGGVLWRNKEQVEPLPNEVRDVVAEKFARLGIDVQDDIVAVAVYDPLVEPFEQRAEAVLRGDECGLVPLSLQRRDEGLGDYFQQRSCLGMPPGAGVASSETQYPREGRPLHERHADE